MQNSEHPAATEAEQKQPNMAVQTAQYLLKIGAVQLYPEKPFILTSGRASPCYVDCRRIISFPEVRRFLMNQMTARIQAGSLTAQPDIIAGGETAGIPFAAWVAERLNLPMLYVRKKTKGFGRNTLIEGMLTPEERVLLVEDLMTDGGSKIAFCNALRDAGAQVSDVMVIFYYGGLEPIRNPLEEYGLQLHYLATWRDILTTIRQGTDFDTAAIDAVESFLHDPVAWSRAHGGC